MSKENKGNNLPKLPAVLNTEPNRRFFDATVNQLFSPKDSERVNGYIGRRDSGTFNPVDDYYLEENTKLRTWYHLEPMVYSRSPETLVDSNFLFYDDMVNRLGELGSLTGNHDRLFSGKYYSYAPPIDVDKMVNYASYFWAESRLPTLNISGMTDSDIEDMIIGKSEFNTSLKDVAQPNSPKRFTISS